MKKTVLLIEDDDADAHLATETLEEYDDSITVMRARDCIEALSFMRGGGILDDQPVIPDLIILDLNMTRMNGYEFLKSLSPADLRDSRIVVWSTTAKAAASLPICKSAEILCIDKPMTLQAFKSRLIEACEPALRAA